MHKLSLKTHPDDDKIFKIKSDVVACCPKFGMALAWPLPAAHILEHCQEVGATPGMPMKTPFILSSHSKDRELKSIKTIGIPEYKDENDAGSDTGSAITESDENNSRAPSPTFVFGDKARRRAWALVIKRLRGWEWLPLPALSLVTSILDKCKGVCK